MIVLLMVLKDHYGQSELFHARPGKWMAQDVDIGPSRRLNEYLVSYDTQIWHGHTNMARAWMLQTKGGVSVMICHDTLPNLKYLGIIGMGMAGLNQ